MKPEKAMEPSDRELPGLRKKSFVLPYRGGMIWFEHLDGLGRFCQGADSKVRRELSRRWAPFGMTVRFESDVEKAKEWLILEKA